jgi:hypothetical protein
MNDACVYSIYLHVGFQRLSLIRDGGVTPVNISQ